MPWDYTSPDSIPVRTTTTLNVDRVVAGRLTIIFAEKVIFFQLDRGPISGSGVDKKDEITYNPVEASYDAIMAAVTNDSETSWSSQYGRRLAGRIYILTRENSPLRNPLLWRLVFVCLQLPTQYYSCPLSLVPAIIEGSRGVFL
jgi:hypothetical protein